MTSTPEYDRQRYEKNILAYRQFVSSTPCYDCNTLFPYYVMEWDHIPGRGNKRFNIAKNAGRGWGKPFLQAELAKCELVCRNCHGIRTHQRMCIRIGCICSIELEESSGHPRVMVVENEST